MVRSHEIWDRIHISEQSMDFGGLARWSASHWDKWIFKKKTDVDGNVTVYEARLVAKSFSQVQGVDYDETFSLVAMLRICWNYISDYCIIYEILQIGCQNIVSSMIFLRKCCMWYNRKVLSILKYANKYAKLQQSFWGLEWASRSWNVCFDDDQRFWVYTKFMRNLYFQRSEWEHYRISDEYMLLTY